MTKSRHDRIVIVHYTDPHCACRNPSTRIGDYRGDVINKLEQVFDIAVDREAYATHCGGDFFHVKSPTMNKHETVSMIVTLLDQYKHKGITHLCNPGNHDLVNDDMDSIPNQPIGVLFAGNHMVQVKGQIIQVGDLRVRMDAYPFTETPDWGAIGTMREASDDNADYEILSAHVYSSPNGGDLFGTKIYSYQEMSVTGHDAYLLGHYHPDNGVVSMDYGLGKDQSFVNIGSLTRGDYGDNNLKRKPKCCVITIEKKDGKVTADFEQIELKVKPAEEVFDLNTKAALEKQKVEAAAFVEELQVATNSVVEEDSAEAIVGKVTNDAAVQKVVKSYLDKAAEFLKGIKDGKNK